MDTLKARLAKIALSLGAATLCLSACHYGLPENVLELKDSWPKDGESAVRVFGPRYFVFSSPLAEAPPAGAVTADFEASLSVSAETLFVTPVHDLRYLTAYALKVNTLTPREGEAQSLNVQVTFTTVGGEREPNDQPGLSDTLRPGALIDGTTDLAGNLTTDNDFFTALPAGNDSFKVTVALEGSAPAFLVTETDSQTLSPAAPALLFSNDTTTFRITNAWGETAYPRGARYRITVETLP